MGIHVRGHGHGLHRLFVDGNGRLRACGMVSVKLKVNLSPTRLCTATAPGPTCCAAGRMGYDWM